MIYNAPSIYKQGGGGGYKDGGELVDGDFIKVENNTISTYDNTIRNNLNFYFEVKDKEPLNSVIELTNNVNATVNVYILKNGIYYLLGNIGGKNVNSGEDYNINIQGNSYNIEQVTNIVPVPYAIDIEGIAYEFVEINGVYWSKTNLKARVGTYFDCGGEAFFYGGDQQEIDKINNFLQTKNCRLPVDSDWSEMMTFLGGGATAINKIRNDNGWYLSQGSNSSGFSLNALGYFNYIGGTNFDVSYVGLVLVDGNINSNIRQVSYDDSVVGFSTSARGSNIRFIYSP